MVKNPTCHCRRLGFHLWVKKIPWRRKCNPLQYSCLGKNFQASLSLTLSVAKDSFVLVHSVNRPPWNHQGLTPEFALAGSNGQHLDQFALIRSTRSDQTKGAMSLCLRVERQVRGYITWPSYFITTGSETGTENKGDAGDLTSGSLQPSGLQPWAICPHWALRNVWRQLRVLMTGQGLLLTSREQKSGWP